MRLPSVNVRLCVALFLLLALASQAAPVDPVDRKILSDFIGTWRDPYRIFRLNLTSDNCEDLVRGPINGEQLVFCDTNHRIRAMWLGNQLNRLDFEDNPPGYTRIPDWIGNLTALTDFRVEFTGMYGTIPESLINPNMVLLNFVSNRLWGSLPRSIENCTNLEIFAASNNLLEGVIPDFTKLKRMRILQLDFNNFKCPQPFMRPSQTTAAQMPAMQRTSCLMMKNTWNGIGDPAGYVCGEEYRLFSNASVCHYGSPIWANVTFPPRSKIVIAPSNHAVTMEVDGGRHAFFSRHPNGTRVDNFSIAFDLLSISSFASSDRRFSAFHRDIPVFAPTNVTQLDAAGRKWHFSGSLTRDGLHVFETFWEWIGTNEIKFSMALSNWTFAPSDDIIQMNLQLVLKSRAASGTLFTACNYLSGDSLSFTETSYIVRCFHCMRCRQNDTEIYVRSLAPSLSSISLDFGVNSTSGSFSLNFPVNYQRDTVDDRFSGSSPSIFVPPFGKTVIFRYLNITDNPINVEYGLNADLSGVRQATIFHLGLEFKRFSNRLFYDPTITLSSLFAVADPPSASPVSVAEIQVEQTLAVGAIVAICVVAALVIIVVAIFILVPQARATIQPFFQKRRVALPTSNEDFDEAEEGSTPGTPQNSEQKRWTVGQRGSHLE